MPEGVNLAELSAFTERFLIIPSGDKNSPDLWAVQIKLDALAPSVVQQYTDLMAQMPTDTKGLFNINNTTLAILDRDQARKMRLRLGDIKQLSEWQLGLITAWLEEKEKIKRGVFSVPINSALIGALLASRENPQLLMPKKETVAVPTKTRSQL